MPKINAADSQIYGAQSTDSRATFRERLMKRFAAHDWVRVINIDNEPFRWQYLPAHAEEFEFTPDPMKITRRGDVEVYQLNPGESEVLIGENAYLMIEGLYKKLVSKKVIKKNPDMQPGFARNFNWTDGKSQEELIERIYLGKENPQFNRPEVANESAAKPGPKPKVAHAATGRIKKAS